MNIFTWFGRESCDRNYWQCVLTQKIFYHSCECYTNQKESHSVDDLDRDRI
ncbi:MAG: hypothetical protein QQW96_14770 [Tychonema bourrellyi B0820]|uniref:hypothetical protein n=1 Tax=Tychonema bourrellyi TaxID=54313 RepID=UPI0015D4CD95|nr:hypothetical protein [Tychonema bourrellyi]MDQ2098900.1 hypothetical protein [Tychonema bourrellyi B0820]